jgi:uncharacterized OB-fold protein
MTQKPAPRATSLNSPYLEGCNQEELRLQQCQAPGCGRHVFYPRVCCPHCGAGDLAWTRVAGTGEITAFSRVHRPQHESFLPEAPYYFIAVRLDEGPLVFSRLQHEGPVPETGLIGQRVRAVFVPHVPGQRLPFFALA